MNAQEIANRNMMVKMLAGSKAYGTSLPTSDTDYRGIFCAEPINILTPFFPVKECEDEIEEDTKLYGLWHFMQLCLDCNPNIIELLWTDNSDITFRTPAYDMLRAQREKLLSSKVAFTTSGYAIAQLKRIKGHNKWITNPQPEQLFKHIEFITLVQWFGQEKMMPRDFDLTKFKDDHRLIPYSQTLFGLYKIDGYQPYNHDTGALNSNFEGDRTELPQPLAIIQFNRDQYIAAKDKRAQYWDWKKNRNEVRSGLEENFGYDTKHAMHLVRLLRMGIEALRDGQIIVKRPDAAELLSIRAGAWTYDELVSYAEEMDHDIREVWYKKTHLPKYPDRQYAAKLLMEVQDLMWTTNNLK